MTSLEDKHDWYFSVAESLTRGQHSNCELEHLPLENFLERIRSFPDESFELVFIDSNEDEGVTRIDQAKAAMRKLKRGGLLVFDDFDKPAYRKADTLLAGWQCRRFTGVKSLPLTAVETAVFFRPLHQPAPRVSIRR